MNALLHQAEQLARLLAETDAEEACAYHHASDLLHHRAGLRSSTRCTRGYAPNRIEQAVEGALIWNRLEEGR